MKSIKKEFSNSKAIIYLEVEPEDEGLRLDEAVRLYLTSQSRESIKRMILNNQIYVENRHCKSQSHTKLRHLDIVKVFRENLLESPSLNILYEDDFLIAVNKPKGIPVHPTGIHHFNVVTTILLELKNEHFYPVHRLDIKTSGVLILAKCKKIAKEMAHLFQSKEIDKVYEFISYKKSTTLIPPVLISFMGNDDKSDITLKQIVKENGKQAITEFFDIIYNEREVKGFAKPITGRLHQIRCHLSFLGYPIVGDEIYGNSSKEDLLMLHCKSMTFIHPVLNKKIHISC